MNVDNSSAGSPPPQAMNNSRAAMSPSAYESMEIALRGEVKSLRMENAELRKQALKAKSLQEEVEYLRNVTLLQHEEKVPIRLRELERDNLRLRRLNSSLEDKLRYYENDEYKHRLFNDMNPIMINEEQTRITAKPTKKDDNESTTTVNASGKVVVIKQGNGACGNCRMKISVVERNALVEKEQLQKQIQDLSTQLDAARKELGAIGDWVNSVVSAGSQYPMLSEQQPVSALPSFISPTRYTSNVNAGQQLLWGTPNNQFPQQSAKPWSSEPRY